jgi:formylglycine-generating enzyme required for sulfatase activity
LDDEQIDKLVKQAYYAIFPRSDAKAKQQADDLLSNIQQLESERRRRLGDNIEPLVDSPIMIRMLLIVHYNDRKLPDQRADLYQKTVDVILRPDHAPDQRVTDEIERRIGGSLAMNREMLQHLAFHMHKQGDEQGREIEEEKLRDILESEPVYKPYVNELISQTRQRGTLLEERGGLYRFIHLSFQEFLVGRYLIQNFPDPNQLVSFLEVGLCSDPWWREPILLAIGYQDLNAPIQARKILSRLAGLDEKANERRHTSFDLTLAACELAATAYLESRNQAADFGEQLKIRLKDLHEQSQTESWSPLILASVADTLDRLGYVPNDLHTFIQISNSQTFISKYLITNAQYERFLRPENFQNKELWMNFPKYDENSKLMKETWGDEPWEWLQKELKDKRYDVQNGVLYPRYWRDPRFGINRRHAPVVSVSWFEANAYCNWLTANYKELRESNSLSSDVRFRLPTESEWVLAAGGEENGRFAFGELKNVKEGRIGFANTGESNIGRTTPVWMYLQGASKPYGLMDMSGNVWEWQANYSSDSKRSMGLRGGSWFSYEDNARVANRFNYNPDNRGNDLGFRVMGVSLPNE